MAWVPGDLLLCVDAEYQGPNDPLTLHALYTFRKIYKASWLPANAEELIRLVEFPDDAAYFRRRFVNVTEKMREKFGIPNMPLTIKQAEKENQPEGRIIETD